MFRSGELKIVYHMHVIHKPTDLEKLWNIELPKVLSMYGRVSIVFFCNTLKPAPFSEQESFADDAPDLIHAMT